MVLAQHPPRQRLVHLYTVDRTHTHTTHTTHTHRTHTHTHTHTTHTSHAHTPHAHTHTHTHTTGTLREAMFLRLLNVHGSSTHYCGESIQGMGQRCSVGTNAIDLTAQSHNRGNRMAHTPMSNRINSHSQTDLTTALTRSCDQNK